MYTKQVNGQALDLEPDGDFHEDDDAEHYHFLEGHTALKFLLAGGVAGAGMSYVSSFDVRFSIFYSFSNVYSTLRQAQSVSHYPSSRAYHSSVSQWAN